MKYLRTRNTKKNKNEDGKERSKALDRKQGRGWVWISSGEWRV